MPPCHPDAHRLNSTGHVQSTVWAFNPIDETFDTSKSAMPTGRARFGASCVDNKYVYVAGGFATAADSDAGRCLSSVDIYDVEQDSWASGPPLSISRGDLALGAVGSKLYALGGYGYEYPYPDPANEANEVLDTATSDSMWQMAAKLPDGGKGDISAVTIGSKIYIPGGWNGMRLLIHPHVQVGLTYPACLLAWQECFSTASLRTTPPLTLGRRLRP